VSESTVTRPGRRRLAATYELNRANLMLNAVSLALARVLDYAGESEMERRWKHARWQFLVAAVIAAIGIVLYATQAPPQAPSRPRVEPVATVHSPPGQLEELPHLDEQPGSRGTLSVRASFQAHP
jgi:hypothetical protein